ncbi:hypothetical protein [Cytobacillus praedii]|uniref:hypothetical protein n=1 Tax=Cytobacillus praedii TaxID=1742358 RepID=UPI003AF84695
MEIKNRGCSAIGGSNKDNLYAYFFKTKDKICEAHMDAEKYSEEELIEGIESGLRTEAEVNEIRNKSYETERIKLSNGSNVQYKVKRGNLSK